MIEDLDLPLPLGDLELTNDYETDQSESFSDSDLILAHEPCYPIYLDNRELFDASLFEHDQISSETIDIDGTDGVSFKASQQEINNHISHAKSEMVHAESNMRHNESIIKSKTRMGEPHSFETSQFNKAEQAYEQARAEYNKWIHMKPDKK